MSKEEKIEKLKIIQKAFIEMLKGVDKIPCDIGLINEAGIYIRDLIKEEENEQ